MFPNHLFPRERPALTEARERETALGSRPFLRTVLSRKGSSCSHRELPRHEGVPETKDTPQDPAPVKDAADARLGVTDRERRGGAYGSLHHGGVRGGETTAGDAGRLLNASRSRGADYGNESEDPRGCVTAGGCSTGASHRRRGHGRAIAAISWCGSPWTQPDGDGWEVPVGQALGIESPGGESVPGGRAVARTRKWFPHHVSKTASRSSELQAPFLSVCEFSPARISPLIFF